jgi:oligopeptide/dipeptide ABC transporter ATP-binding protein
VSAESSTVAAAPAETLLEVSGLHVHFATDDGTVRAVDGVGLSLGPARTLALVGESGSGKSVTCLAIMGFMRGHNVTTSGTVTFKGRDLLGMSARELRSTRGTEIAMVFQDPMTSLNPVYRIGAQLVEAIRLHRDIGRDAARTLALEALEEVGIPDARRRIDAYPHEFSGGMRQRVMVAMALINRPDLLIADEPTTALDVTTQAQLLALIARLQEERRMSVIFVTHDLGVVAQIADEVAVMYAGQVVERAPVHAAFRAARHPYTWGLLGSIPRLDSGQARLRSIPGAPPALRSPPDGCRFHPRCRHRMAKCSSVVPSLTPAPGDPLHLDACLLDEETKRREGQTMAGSATP